MPVAQGGLAFLFGGGAAAATVNWYPVGRRAGGGTSASLQAGGAAPSDSLVYVFSVGTNAPPFFILMQFGSGTAVASSSALPASPPDGPDSFRTGLYNGTIPAGTWTLNFSVLALTAGGSQDGRIRARIWRSPSPTGAGAVELTSGIQTGTTVTNLTTTTPQTSTVTVALPSITLTNEYVFVQVAWDVTGAGASAFCDVMLLQGAASFFSTPAFPREIPQFYTALTASDFTELDFSTRMLSYHSRRGREDALSGITAGELSVELDDDDGALDPENTASPYTTQIKLRRRFEVTAEYGGISYPRGTAYAESYTATPLALGANVTIRGQDLYKQLLQRTVTASYPAQADYERIEGILTTLGYSLTYSSDGSFRPPAVTLTEEPVLNHFDLLTKAGRGTFFIGADGVPIYRDRHWRLAQVSIGTFGAQGDYAIPAPSPVLDDAGLFNRIILHFPSAVTADDSTSQADYGVIPYTLDDDAATMLANAADGVQWADWFLYQHKTPTSRFQSIDIDPSADSALWPLVLAADIGTKITIMHDLPGTKGIVSQDYYIEGIEDTCLLAGEPDLRVRWSISQAETDSGHFWILDVADVLETDTILSY
jgi:hypothetical protein